MNLWADLRREIAGMFSCDIDVFFLSSDAYFPPDAPPSSPLGPPLLPPPVRSETTLAKSIDDILATQTEQEVAIEYVSFHSTRVDSLSSRSHHVTLEPTRTSLRSTPTPHSRTSYTPHSMMSYVSIWMP